MASVVAVPCFASTHPRPDVVGSLHTGQTSKRRLFME